MAIEPFTFGGVVPMCCFAGSVQSVTSTRIFGRLSGSGTQFIAYQMKYQSTEPNAMILPVPTHPSADEDAVRFIDLSGYDRFFADMNRGFPAPPKPLSVNSRADLSESARRPQLQIHRVGNFDASFVPTMDDFDRLERRFVIPRDVWAKLPEYKDWGFAVFQLHELAGEPHPMAFEFETRRPDTVFFPTVHIHDGEVHATEDFHHTLYTQHAPFDAVVGKPRWRVDPATKMVRSNKVASSFMKIEKTQGIVDGDLLVHRRTMNGNFPNKDVWVAASGSAPKQSLGSWKSSKTLLPLGLALPVAWIIRRRQQLR